MLQQSAAGGYEQHFFLKNKCIKQAKPAAVRPCVISLASASLASGVLKFIHFPCYATVFQYFLTPDRDFMLDAFYDIFAGLDGFGAMDGGGKNKQTDLACQDGAETVVDMETVQRIGFEGSLSDFVELEIGHFRVSGVFDGSDWFAVDHIISNLAEENAVGTYVLFGAVGGD